MHRYTALVLSSVALTAACATGTTGTAAGEIAPVRPINANWIPAGTTMIARLDQSIGAASNRSGDSFTATVVNAVYAQDGSIAVPVGAILHGRINGLHRSSIPGEQSVIRLAFEDIQMHGHSFPVTASISNVALERQATPSTASSTTKGAGTGAVLGTVISGADLSKIITGGILGAATGTVISLGTGGTETVVPSGSTFTVRTNEDVRFRL